MKEIYSNSLNLMGSLVNSLKGNNNKESKNVLTIQSRSLSELQDITSASKSTLPQISKSAKKLNSLYHDVQKTGDENAISGFKQYVIGAATGMNGAGFENFVKMGEAAFKNKDSGFFTGLLGNYNYLTANRKSSLGDMMMKEAGETFKELGLESAKAFSNASNAVLDAKEKKSQGGEVVTTFDTLANFVSAWKDIRSQKTDEKEKTARLNDIAKGVSAANNTLDMNAYIDKVKSTPKK